MIKGKLSWPWPLGSVNVAESWPVGSVVRNRVAVEGGDEDAVWREGEDVVWGGDEDAVWGEGEDVVAVGDRGEIVCGGLVAVHGRLSWPEAAVNWLGWPARRFSWSARGDGGTADSTGGKR